MSATATESPITRADIESKLRELQGSATRRVDTAAATGVKVATPWLWSSRCDRPAQGTGARRPSSIRRL
jgi:hypothetical protein